jgi:tetratricopeptide (TPR) repeat protein/class 3 adenylate cyclase
MSATDHTGPPQTTKLEMAHVLFMDIVGYSKLPMDHQEAVLHSLQIVVSTTSEFLRAQSSNEIIKLPTGDGMALVFFEDAEAAARCALEVSQALKSHPEILLRMGLHSGPVYRVTDINANKNVAGGGINIAQRVMDCGDAGHILASQSVADVLGQLSSWKDYLHDLGEAEVKHGVRVHLYNLYTKEAGNLEPPNKVAASKPAAETAAALKPAQKSARHPAKIVTGATILVIGLAVSGWLFFSRKAHALTDKDTIVLADFTNKTGDAIFDDTLKTALNVSLRQSPFLNVLSDSEVAKTLKFMTRPADTKLTPEVARELCQRAGSKAYLAGTIGSLGSEYVLGLKAVNCQSGDTLAEEQVTATSKERVLDTLGEATTKLRGELGESLASVEKLDVPLEQATTSSLEALQAFSLGEKAYNEKGSAAALPYVQRAIQLDPNFATAYSEAGNVYASLGEPGRASEYYTKAFELREHASEPEKLRFTALYYWGVTGELEKASQTYLQWIESYPRDYYPHNDLGIVYAEQGQYERAAAECREGLRLGPDDVFPYEVLANSLLALQRFDGAQQIIQQAQARKLDDWGIHDFLYGLAFLRGDSLGMADQQQWFGGRPNAEHFGLSHASDTEAYAGHLHKARELTKRSVGSAIGADNKEAGAIWQAIAAQREAAFGNLAEAKQAAVEALKLVPTSQGVEDEAALAFAMAGDTARAESLVQALEKRYPVAAQMQSLWLPGIRAQLALNRKNPLAAIDNLKPALPPIEYGWVVIGFTRLSCLYPTYIRGEAYLAAGQGVQAVAEFQKILDHSGIVVNCWTGALARLGVARGNALQARTAQGADADAARVRALAAYKDFLALWKDADPDIPILKDAKAEYAKLQ